MMKRIGLILMSLLLASCLLPANVLAEDYSDYSNQEIFFGLNLREDHKKPGAEKPGGVVLSDYNTWYYSKPAYDAGEKVIYLTFDCGYENGNTPKILDALKEADVKAIFFVTVPFVKENPDLVKRMKEEGHLVGNHTTNHPRLPECSVAKVKDEIRTCEKTVEKLTGYKMDHYLRPPEGAYSLRVMKVLQDMGYATMLWSLAIYDYEENDQPGAAYVIDKFKKHHFCGMMPLLHVISTSDTEALPDVIREMKAEGYRFGLVNEFAHGQTDSKNSKKFDMEKMNRK